ncbi:helix-turn-helix domain-containing protein [Paenibacillus tundrae]
MRQKLRQLRLDRGISQSFISKKLGFSYPSGYSNIEAGRNRLNYDHAIIIANLLGVDVSELDEDANFFAQKLHKTCNKESA